MGIYGNIMLESIVPFTDGEYTITKVDFIASESINFESLLEISGSDIKSAISKFIDKVKEITIKIVTKIKDLINKIRMFISNTTDKVLHGIIDSNKDSKTQADFYINTNNQSLFDIITNCNDMLKITLDFVDRFDVKNVDTAKDDLDAQLKKNSDYILNKYKFNPLNLSKVNYKAVILKEDEKDDIKIPEGTKVSFVYDKYLKPEFKLLDDVTKRAEDISKQISHVSDKIVSYTKHHEDSETISKVISLFNRILDINMKLSSVVINSAADMLHNLNSISKKLAKAIVGEKIENVKTNIKDVFAGIKAKLNNSKILRDQWSNTGGEFKTKIIVEKKYKDDSEKQMIEDAFETLKKDENELEYPEYRKAFETICKYVNIDPDKTVLEYVKPQKDKVSVKYSSGLIEIKIPGDLKLIHVSPLDDLDKRGMFPAFRSKKLGTYMYPEPRCFFTIGKEIKANDAGLENTSTTTYETVEKFTKAYIDPTYPSYHNRSVFVRTDGYIKLKKVNPKDIETVF